MSKLSRLELLAATSLVHWRPGSISSRNILHALKASCVAVATALILTVGAQAAGVAERTIFGFNKQGTLFAFEQFGIQDGTDDRYSAIHHLKTTAWPLPNSSLNTFAPNMTLQPPTATIGHVREHARMNLSSVAKVHHFLEMGHHVFHHALNETPVNTTSALFAENYPNTLLGQTGSYYNVTVTESNSTTNTCVGGGVDKAFKVTLTKNLGAPLILWAKPNGDPRMPPPYYGYTCPANYSIADVVLHKLDTGVTKIAVLVSVMVRGFEGPDRGFIAVLGELN